MEDDIQPIARRLELIEMISDYGIDKALEAIGDLMKTGYLASTHDPGSTIKLIQYIESIQLLLLVWQKIGETSNVR